MTDGPYLLGIDFGTGGARVGIFDPEGTPVVFSEREYTLKHPRPGWAEQDPDDWTWPSRPVPSSHVWISTDFVRVEVCAAAKNCYALGTGFMEGESGARYRNYNYGATLEGTAATEVMGDALPKLTERGIIEPEDSPLMRHLHSVVGSDEPLDMPWHTFFGGEPESKAGKG